MGELSFKVSHEDNDLIEKIADRAVNLAEQCGEHMTVFDVMMDVTAAHVNDHAIDLADLLAADNADFAHDVFGIRHHIDRSTGKLGDCFVPRYAAREAVRA